MIKNFYDVASCIDMKYVEEAASFQPRSIFNNIFFKICATCASFLIIITASMSIYFSSIEYKASDDDGSLSGSDEIGILKPWNEQELYEQYPTALFNNIEYSSGNRMLNKNVIGDTLGSENLLGNDNIHIKNATLFSINGVNSECAIAIKFANDEKYYVYKNSSYFPQTLGEFKSDLNLRENLITGKIYSNENRIISETISANDVLNLLLDDDSIATEKDFDSLKLTKIWGISVDVDILGHENVTITITEEGYAWTNILDTGKAFYIGQEKISKFMSYVKEKNP